MIGKSRGIDGAPGTSKTVLLLLLTVVLLMVSVRVAYWLSIDEKPFSDMADYFAISKRVWCCFNFDHTEFWRSYKPPGMPILAAPFVGPFSDDLGLWVWRIVTMLLVGGSAFWLAKEFFYLLRSRLLALLFLITVALSKSSIFWSYRFSTESLTEGLTYLVLGYFLNFMRRPANRTLWFTIGLGAATVLLSLVRPNMVLLIGLIPLSIAMQWWRSHPRRYQPLIRHLSGFGIGVAVLWTPWLIRGIEIYGRPVPFSTQGPYSFLWEADGFNFEDPQLGMRNVNVQALQVEAPKRFANDLEAAALATEAGRQWLANTGYRPFARIILSRLQRMVDERGITLARTPREVLFTDVREYLLLDKSMTVAMLAVAGLFTGIFAFGLTYLCFAMMLAAPILFSAVFMGEPRLLEPFIPLILFNAAICIVAVARLGQRVSGGVTGKSGPV